MSQLIDGKCLRCASFLSNPQNTYKLNNLLKNQLIFFLHIYILFTYSRRYHTCTIPSVALVTGSEKSPPGGDTAPTILTDPSRSGFPKHLTLKIKIQYFIYTLISCIYINHKVLSQFLYI